MTKEHFRLTYYKYPKYGELFELYNLSDDPEEINNIFSSGPSVAIQMKDELLQKLSDVNKPFE